MKQNGRNFFILPHNHVTQPYLAGGQEKEEEAAFYLGLGTFLPGTERPCVPSVSFSTIRDSWCEGLLTGETGLDLCAH